MAKVTNGNITNTPASRGGEGGVSEQGNPHKCRCGGGAGDAAG